MAACIAIVLMLGIATAFVTGPLSLIPLVGIAASLPILYRAYTATGSKTQGFLDSRALADSTLLEYLGGIAELKANGITGRGFTPWTMANARASSPPGWKWGRRPVPLLYLSVGYSLYRYRGCRRVGRFPHRADAAVLLFILLISGRFYEPLQNIGVFLTEFRFATESLRRITSIFRKRAPQLPGYTPPADLNIYF